MEQHGALALTTTTYADSAAGAALLTDVPALVTRFSPPAACATDWYFDQGSAASVFSDPAHNPAGWHLCQPYNETGGHFSAGVCPSASEFKRVTRYQWEGASEEDGNGPEDFWLGACCGSSSTLSLHTGTESACFSVTTPDPSVVATMLLENGAETRHIITTEVTVVATPLYIVWHEADTALHAESDAESLRVAMGVTNPTVQATAPPTPTSSPSTTPSDDNEGKEVAAEHTANTKVIIAGAVAGVACAALIALVSFLLWRRRRSRRRKDGAQTPPGTAKGHHGGADRRFYDTDLGCGEQGQSATQVGSELELDRELVEMKVLRSEVTAENGSQSSNINNWRSTPRFG